ncbi:MAG: hypothetical protein DCC53_15480 [Chloroflexi bacterium]|nr:MAG: hypothetical protein DCC53_15480 [Chloroflexota bacterium]
MAEEWAALRGLDGEIAGRVRQVAPPPHLLGTVLQAARTSRRRSRSGLGWAVAAAAVLLLIVTNVFWLSRPSLSLGVFRVDETGRGMLAFDATLLGDTFDVLGVTREPLNGSPGPTSDPVVRWQSS